MGDLPLDVAVTHAAHQLEAAPLADGADAMMAGFRDELPRITSGWLGKEHKGL